MLKKKFRFKTEYFTINDVHNIPALIIASGFGLCFDTFCCKKCGEIFVIDLETLYHQKTNIENFVESKNCPTCGSELKSNLVKYPENIFYKGQIFVNNTDLNKSNFENTKLIEVFEIE